MLGMHCDEFHITLALTQEIYEQKESWPRKMRFEGLSHKQVGKENNQDKMILISNERGWS